ncbi:TIGR01777 family oxidoreductase [Methylicorpusculum sp.]|uniref:TIGR01777 family oxidoreductase n=1 Tax=Methylicorpusculum sp. TaxID=2713644 RepID=UPI00272EF40E|nr:TIGR01777 family oxidoreductase [Methylicorpusculum sp.]MDP2177378.1 TIGR01777 family oxidoreductase [Methylicorpusculum sp.]MDP3530975.1 TIGR01777 family oxidoreductase [Methylicorpusculum sp.]MDZ4151724.1 TIGR01777 family oxidoreductase [Methylicorpusculum sp.]
MKVLLTGGTGFIGKALIQSLLQSEHQITVLSRNPQQVAELCGKNVAALGRLDELTAEDHFDAVINLAGAPIFDRRWTDARKQLIWDSRVKLTEQLIEAINKMKIKPQVLISGSAIGYYGNQGDTELTEQSSYRDDFSHRLCEAWETEAKKAEALGVRVCIIRTGLVVAPGGGIVGRMLLPFKLGLGGRIGDGKQWMSWIHRDDWINIALAMIDNQSMQGVYNATAPVPRTNAEFTKVLADCLKRPALIPVPAFLLNLLLGEMAELVLGSQRVLPKRLLDQAFQFKYTELDDALLDAVK